MIMYKMILANILVFFNHNDTLKSPKKDVIILVPEDKMEKIAEDSTFLTRVLDSLYRSADEDVKNICIRHTYLIDKDFSKMHMVARGLYNIVYFDNIQRIWKLKEYTDPNFIPYKTIIEKFGVEVIVVDKSLTNIIKDDSIRRSIIEGFRQLFFTSKCDITINTYKIDEVIRMTSTNNNYYVFLFDENVNTNVVRTIVRNTNLSNKYFMYSYCDNSLVKINVERSTISIGGDKIECPRYKGNKRTSN